MEGRGELAVSKISEYELLQNMNSDKWAPNSHVGGNKDGQYLYEAVVIKRNEVEFSFGL